MVYVKPEYKEAHFLMPLWLGMVVTYAVLALLALVYKFL